VCVRAVHTAIYNCTAIDVDFNPSASGLQVRSSALVSISETLLVTCRFTSLLAVPLMQAWVD
jgi:hypothetical protein